MDRRTSDMTEAQDGTERMGLDETDGWRKGRAREPTDDERADSR